jgi:hypothetical protein
MEESATGLCEAVDPFAIHIGEGGARFPTSWVEQAHALPLTLAVHVKLELL